MCFTGTNYSDVVDPPAGSLSTDLEMINSPAGSLSTDSEMVDPPAESLGTDLETVNSPAGLTQRWLTPSWKSQH